MSSALMRNYLRHDVAFERGEGPYVFAAGGRRYLDFGAGIAVASLGHAHPRLVEALRNQSERIWHCSNLYRIPEQERLADRLVEESFADAAFFCNSGAEALECAFKLVRKFHDDTGHPERYRVVTFRGGFHGRTLATIAAGRTEKLIAGFEPLVDGFDQVAFGDLNAARAAITAETAAIVVEPIQGEGGIQSAPDGFLEGLRQMADDHGLLLVFDEVQTGMGRTGRLFAHEWAGVSPDVMGLAKGLGGGFPIGACLAAGPAAETLTPGSHGSTFGGNPLAMAVANAVLDEVLADGFLERVQTVGEGLRKLLAPLPARYPGVIAEVRGFGLMLGLKCVGDASGVVRRLLENGLLVIPAADSVVRLLPPLIIEESHASEATAIIERTCAELSDKAA